MKHFFKTIAIFACFGLLLGACDTVEVEDESVAASGTPVVGNSSILYLQSGNGKFYIEWLVGTSELIDRCVISWTCGSISGSATVDVERSTTASYTIMSYTTTELLEPGEYIVKLTNESDSEIVTGYDSQTVEIFGDNTYDGYTGAIIDTMYRVGTDAYVQWGDLPEDCAGVVVTYTQSDNTVVETDLISTGSATLTNVMNYSTFTFVSCFQPEGGIDGDYVDVANTDYTYTSLGVAVDDITTTAPTSATATAGIEKIMVVWNPSDSTEVVKSIISYTNGEQIYSATINNPTLGEDNTYILTENIVAGETYTVTVKNERSEYSTTSAETSAGSVTVYNGDVYSVGASIGSVTYDGTDATINWEYIPEDCTGVTISYYQANASSLTVIDEEIALGTGTVLTNAAAPSYFLYSTRFRPSDGYEDFYVVNNSTENVIIGLAPSAPLSVKATPGDGKLTVVWSNSSTDNLAKTIVTCTDQADYEILLADMSNGDNTYTFDNLTAGKTYSVTVTNYSAAGAASTTIPAYGLTVYNYDDFLAACVTPTIGTITYDKDTYLLTFDWSNVGVNCSSISLTYDNLSGTTTTVDATASLGSSLTLSDAAPLGSYSYEVTYVPSVGAADYKTETITGTFPEAYVTKSYMSIYERSGYDATFNVLDSETANERLFDGYITSGMEYCTQSFKTTAGQGITIDLGMTYKLSAFTVYSILTTQYGENYIKNFTLQATTDPDGTWTTLLDNQDVDSSSFVASEGGHKFEIDSDMEVRYVSFLINSTYGDDTSGIECRLQEFDFWHKGLVSTIE